MSNYAGISVLERDTTQAMVTNQLRKFILTQQIKAGERLVQDDLAQRLGVSRTPVREAIRQLETENLVTVLPYKGAIVAEVSAEELEGLYQIRIALQTHASRLVMENVQANDVSELKFIVQDMRNALEDDPEQLLAANRRFSVYFYKLAKQPQLFDLIMSYLEKSKRFRQQHFYNEEHALRTVVLHEALVDYIQAKDVEAVVRQMHHELRRIADELIALLQETRDT